MKNLKKLFLLIFISLNIFSLSVPPAMAGLLSEITPVEAMNEIMADLGVDKNELKYSIQTSNASRMKKQQPQVSLAFDPINPIADKKVTVVASPTYFNNDYKNLYFTWYLKLNGCDLDNNPAEEIIDKCDMDDNKKITVEDWKIKAARITAASDFEREADTYSKDTDDDGYNASLGGEDQRGKANHCFIHDISSGNEYEMKSGASLSGTDLCDHLFPHAGGKDTGDGSFGADEEKFWHTNPDDPDTADLGEKDEAIVSGLGINSFSWIYEPGDQVGLIVEGVSNEAAQEYDSSYRIMWALPKNICDIDYVNKTAKHNYRKAYSPGNNHFNYYYTDMPASAIDHCLEGALVDPANEGGINAEKLDVTLTYSPETPINDPEEDSKEGDELIVSSSITNAYNTGYLNYFWQVYQSDEPNPESWGSPFLKEALKDSSQTTGLGLSTFKFRLNFPNPKKYLRIKLTATENSGRDGITRQGHGSVVIPIYSTSERIKAYGTIVSLTAADDTLNLSLDDPNEICNQGMDKTVCPALKDKIIGLKVNDRGLTDFLWTINGKPITYKECFFDECQLDKASNVAFFPILEDVGFEYVIAMTATNQKTGQKVKLTKTFKVSDPEIKIVSVREKICAPLLLGYYVDLDGKLWPDFSKTAFTALAEKPITLKLVSNTFGTNYNWFVDKILIDKSNAGSRGYSFDETDNLVLTGKIFGEYYDVSANAFYSPDMLTKKALHRFWEVPLNDFYESRTSATIKIDMVGSITEYASGAKTKNKIFASVYSAAPSYLIFLLKIVITTFLMLFTSGILLSFFPNLKQNE